MPYENEFADKASHSDIIKNPDVKTFLEECSYLREPSSKEIENLEQKFIDTEVANDTELPKHIFAIDGSSYEALIDDRLPSTKVGYIKVNTIHISTEEFGALRIKNGQLVDPFRVARLRKNKDSLLFVLPGTNMKWNGYDSVRDSFRSRLDQELLKNETRFIKNDYKTSLRSTLFYLASTRPENQEDNFITLHQCPSCNEKNIKLVDTLDSQFCHNCGNEVYISDVLRIWEEVTDFQSSVTALTRFMLAVEHMLPAHYLRYLIDHDYPLNQLSNIAFFIDGPLAIFGNCAWLSRPLMKFYHDINAKLTNNGYDEITIIGLQKTGQLVDYFSIITKYISENKVFCIDDDYRYKYIIASRSPSMTGFGSETYYGQDFLYKTNSGRRFVVGIPYPFSHKNITNAGNFHALKTNIDKYKNLNRALGLIHKFETDLYSNAVIPIALAHRYTAISAVPGGKVLDILSRDEFGGKS